MTARRVDAAIAGTVDASCRGAAHTGKTLANRGQLTKDHSLTGQERESPSTHRRRRLKAHDACIRQLFASACTNRPGELNCARLKRSSQGKSTNRAARNFHRALPLFKCRPRCHRATWHAVTGNGTGHCGTTVVARGARPQLPFNQHTGESDASPEEGARHLGGWKPASNGRYATESGVS